MKREATELPKFNAGLNRTTSHDRKGAEKAPEEHRAAADFRLYQSPRCNELLRGRPFDKDASDNETHWLQTYLGPSCSELFRWVEAIIYRSLRLPAMLDGRSRRETCLRQAWASPLAALNAFNNNVFLQKGRMRLYKGAFRCLCAFSFCEQSRSSTVDVFRKNIPEPSSLYAIQAR